MSPHWRDQCVRWILPGVGAFMHFLHMFNHQLLWETFLGFFNENLSVRSAWWRYQMEAFSALLALCERNPPVTGGFPSQRPVTRSFDFFFLDLRLNDSGDLRRHCAHDDVTVMVKLHAYLAGVTTALQWDNWVACRGNSHRYDTIKIRAESILTTLRFDRAKFSILHLSFCEMTCSCNYTSCH